MIYWRKKSSRMVSTVADQKTQRNKWLIAHLQRMRKKRKEDDGVAVNQPPEGAPLGLGDLTVDTGLVVSSAELLAGATDADGDTLTVTSVTAVSGGTVTGTDPWTITPTAEGAGSATVVISDGRGGIVNRTVTWNGVAPPADYDEFLQWSSSVLGDDLTEFANWIAKTATEDLP